MPQVNEYSWVILSFYFTLMLFIFGVLSFYFTFMASNSSNKISLHEAVLIL